MNHHPNGLLKAKIGAGNPKVVVLVVDMVVENDIQQDNCRELHTELSYLSLLPAVKLV